MGFFPSLFGFAEENYSQAQTALLEIARLTPLPLKVPGSDAEDELHHGRAIYRERCEFLAVGTGVQTKSGTGDPRETLSAGIFWMPSVNDLRRLVVNADSKRLENAGSDSEDSTPAVRPKWVLKNIVGEARSMHESVVANGDVVQGASQFNTLEFPTPEAVPEWGIEGYIYDPTQGPACATACFAGTAYRNYLVPVSSCAVGNTNEAAAVAGSDATITTAARGQTAERQLNGLDRVEAFLTEKGLFPSSPWTVRNGYIEVSSSKDLARLNEMLLSDTQLRDEIVSRVCIGIQEDTEVTDVLLGQLKRRENPWKDPAARKFVTQTYNSAISIGYSQFPESLWKPIARLVLDATYEATLLVGALKTIGAIQQEQQQQQESIETKKGSEATKKIKRPTIFLTKVGGGVFQNNDDWIRASISRAVERVDDLCGISLDVRIVHFRKIDPRYRELETA